MRRAEHRKSGLWPKGAHVDKTSGEHGSEPGSDTFSVAYIDELVRRAAKLGLGATLDSTRPPAMEYVVPPDDGATVVINVENIGGLPVPHIPGEGEIGALVRAAERQGLGPISDPRTY